eukprot:8274836-Ditylum_brightwellii.AAC.1
MPTLFMFISVAALMIRAAISARLAAIIVPKGGSRPFPDDGTKSAEDSVAFSDATYSSTSADSHAEDLSTSSGCHGKKQRQEARWAEHTCMNKLPSKLLKILRLYSSVASLL